jgi:hypothetical protein
LFFHSLAMLCAFYWLEKVSLIVLAAPSLVYLLRLKLPRVVIWTWAIIDIGTKRQKIWSNLRRTESFKNSWIQELLGLELLDLELLEQVRHREVNRTDMYAGTTQHNVNPLWALRSVAYGINDDNYMVFYSWSSIRTDSHMRDESFKYLKLFGRGELSFGRRNYSTTFILAPSIDRAIRSAYMESDFWNVNSSAFILS